MFFGALRSVIRPVSRTILSPRSPFIFPITSSPSPACDSQLCHHLLSPFLGNVGGIPASNAFHSARRPTAEEQLVVKRSNQGSARRRNEKNRIKPHRAISPSEKKKLKAQIREANRRKLEEYRLNYHMIKEIRKEAREIYKRIESPWYRIAFERWRRDFLEGMKEDAVLAAMSYYKKIQKYKLLVLSKQTSRDNDGLRQAVIKTIKRTEGSSITGMSGGSRNIGQIIEDGKKTSEKKRHKKGGKSLGGIGINLVYVTY